MDTQIQNISLKDKFLSLFLEDTGSKFINTIRLDAIHKFEELGFPTLKHEDWKYTSLAGLLKVDWQEYPENDYSEIKPEDIQRFLVPGLCSDYLVFVNGKYVKHLSKVHENTHGVIIESFEEAQNLHQDIIEKYFSKYAHYQNNAFVALNTALASDGAFVYIPKGVQHTHTIQLVNITGYGQADSFSNTRNLVILEEGAKTEIVENNVSYHNSLSLGEGRGEVLSSFNTIVNELVVSKKAQLNYYKSQSENELAYQVNFTQIDQEKDSLCNTYTSCLGGKFLRNDLNFLLNDSHCESHMFGLYIGNKQQLIDNHTFVDHANPDCFSNEFYKGIIAGQATAVFNGKIIVRPDAQKTNAYQSNKNILLSDEGRINTKPQLEIFADDVKCSHGATTGQLDDEALFYLRSRGIGEEKARAMLTLAFAEDVLENIKQPEIKVWIEEQVEAKLKTIAGNG